MENENIKNHEKLSKKGLLNRMITVKLVMLLIVLGMLAGCSINRMIFPCRRSYSVMTDAVMLRVADGVSIAVRYIANPTAKYTVLFNHGNYEDLGTLTDFTTMYSAQGFAIVVWDYRGYGISGGSPGEKNVNSDAKVVYDYMVNDLKIASENIIIHGRSVGSGPACTIAAENECGGLIVESGFKSVFSTVLPCTWLPGDKFVNINKIDKINCTKLFIHGGRDGVVPLSHALAMFDKAGEPKYKLWLDKAGHNDILWLAEDEYWNAISDFSNNIAGEKLQNKRTEQHGSD